MNTKIGKLVQVDLRVVPRTGLELQNFQKNHLTH